MNKFNCFLLGYFAGAIFALTLTIMLESTKPQAIDVYRGYTTLEITHRDSIPVDSIVVFKNK